MCSYNYTSLGEQPEAPLIEIQITSLEATNPKTVSWTAFLDTGSDCTLVPLDALNRIQAKIASSKVDVFGVGGKKSTVYPYYVAFTMDSLTLPLVRVYGCPIQDTNGIVIVGRDLLNQYCIQFDGPKHTFTFIY